MGTRLPLKLLLTISLLLILQGGADAATVFGGKSSPPAVTEWPMPQRTPVSHWVGATPGSSSKGGLVEISPAKPEARKLKWRFGIHYFQGTANDLGEVLTGQCDTISQNGIRLSAGVVLVEDLCDWPIDILARAGIMWHNEQSAQDDLLQYSLAIEFELKKFRISSGSPASTTSSPGSTRKPWTTSGWSPASPTGPEHGASTAMIAMATQSLGDPTT